MCGRRLAVKHYVWHGDDCGRVQSCVWPVSAILTAAAPDVVREWVLISYVGSTPVTEGRFSRLDDRPIDIMPSAPPQPVTPYGVFLSLWRCNRAPPLRRSPHLRALHVEL